MPKVFHARTSPRDGLYRDSQPGDFKGRIFTTNTGPKPQERTPVHGCRDGYNLDKGQRRGVKHDG
jgi:hypothetical protein